jgi:hypothetical protein
MNGAGAGPEPVRGGAPTLTFRGGGWLIALTVAVVLAVVVWALAGVWSGHHPVGDGRTVESYGFRLEPLLADRAFLAASGNPRDFLTALDAPRTIRGADMLEYNRSQRRKHVVTTDRVLGVVVHGEARAYPLAMMNAHEIVNDTLGGVPIAVTFSPLTDSAVVFDRRVGGAERLFRVSGLLLSSNLVMYDAAPPAPAAPAAPGRLAAPAAPGAGEPSLWSQLGMRAIAGPAAAEGLALAPLPGVNICAWSQWLAAHPDTTVILPEPEAANRYKELSYARYGLTPHIPFPVRNLQPEAREAQTVEDAIAALERGDPPTRKTAVVVVRAGGATARWTLPELLARTGNRDGVWTTELGGVPLRVAVQRQPMSVLVEAPGGEPVVVVPQLWFAARAFEP